MGNKTCNQQWAQIRDEAKTWLVAKYRQVQGFGNDPKSGVEFL